MGEAIGQCSDLESVKILYTQYFLNYLFNGLAIVPFTKKLLQALEYLDMNEFHYFVVHAYHDDDLETIVRLIDLYRSLSNKGEFHDKFRNYFEQIKGPIASNVYGNYTKKNRHTVSAIGWCAGFNLSTDSSNNLVLRLVDE